jgi:hypothetical protein
MTPKVPEEKGVLYVIQDSIYSNKINHGTSNEILKKEPTVGQRANVAEWRRRRHFAAFALSCITTS